MRRPSAMIQKKLPTAGPNRRNSDMVQLDFKTTQKRGPRRKSVSAKEQRTLKSVAAEQNVGGPTAALPRPRFLPRA